MCFPYKICHIIYNISSFSALKKSKEVGFHNAHLWGLLVVQRIEMDVWMQTALLGGSLARGGNWIFPVSVLSRFSVACHKVTMEQSRLSARKRRYFP